MGAPEPRPRIKTVSLARICCDKPTDASELKLWRPLDAMTKSFPKFAALAVLSASFVLSPFADAKPKKGGTVRGRASYHSHTSRMVTAARVPRGSKLWVWHGNKSEASGFAVTVNDSGPYTSGRVLDLSTGAFTRLYGGLNRGVGPVCYRVMK